MSKKKLIARVINRYQNRVRECRLQVLVPTQKELAQMAGISPITISFLENNRLFLSSHYALLIAEALACRLGDLYEKRYPPRNQGSIDEKQKD